MMRRRNSYEELFHENKPVYTYLTYRTSRGEVVFRHNTTKHWLRAQTCMLQTPGDTSVLRNPEENKDEELASWDYYFYLRLINEGEAKKSHEDLIMDHIVSKFLQNVDTPLDLYAQSYVKKDAFCSSICPAASRCQRTITMLLKQMMSTSREEQRSSFYVPGNFTKGTLKTGTSSTTQTYLCTKVCV